ncbi:thioredoxin family protein [Sediminimonas sp.]|uniref:thioredoxin family protein n=1 Tax=Sediminimonas sp. TaxID=2823379 RepID=UPI0025D36416|nr:thioredoxin family protein [Sediminimonas sp.]
MRSLPRFLRRHGAALVALLAVFAALPGAARAVELIMVEQQGCQYCIAWKQDLGPIYPKTDAGQFAPLRMVDMDDGLPADVAFKGPVIYTPTFILVDAGREMGRIEGHPGDDFFWALLERMLAEKTDFPGSG